MPADETTLAAGRTPVVLARGVGLTAAVLAGGVAGHCLAGGHVPGPAVLAAVGALVLVTGVLGARSLVRSAADPADGGRDVPAGDAAPLDSAHPVAPGGSPPTGRWAGRRAAAALAAAALAVALHPVLALLSPPPGAARAVATDHAAHGAAPVTGAAGDPAAGDPGGGDAAAGDPPAAGAGETSAVDLDELRAAGIDLEAVRAAGTDLDALVAAGLDASTLTAAGLDPTDPHAPHTVAALVAAADRAADQPAADQPAVDQPAADQPAAGDADGADRADVGLLGLAVWSRTAAVAATALLTALLAAVALTVDLGRAHRGGVPPGRRRTVLEA